MIELSETYITISGESPIMGEPVFIVRCAGCNLSCTYCDSKYTNVVRSTVSEDELTRDIASKVASYPAIKVLFTGGEPLTGGRQRSIMNIVRALPDVGFFIETNGSVEIEDLTLANCSYVVDMKTPSSGHEDSFAVSNLDRLRPGLDCIKIVLAESDFPWVSEKIRFIKSKQSLLPVFLSPQCDALALPRLAEFILSNKLPVRISIQLHKLIWGKDAKGV